MNLKIYKSLLCIAFAVFISACSNNSEVANKGELSYIPLCYKEVLEEEDGINEYNYTKVIDINSGKELFSINGRVETLFQEGYAIASFDDGGYFINLKGEKKFGPYVSATGFNDGIALVVEQGGKIKAINTSGKVLFTLDESDAAAPFNEGMALCDYNGSLATVDKKGNITNLPISSLENFIPWFINGTFICQTQGESGKTVTRLINKKGDYTDLPYGVSIKCEFDSDMDLEECEEYIYGTLLPMKSGKLFAHRHGKYGVISTKGEWIINPQFDDIYKDGPIYLFEKGNRYGWCDASGKYIINPVYREAFPFGNCELALVEDDNNELKYIDKKGEIVIDAKSYRSAKPFTSSGIAFVQDHSRDYGAIDKNGVYVINPQYMNVIYLSDNRFLTRSHDGMLAIIDEKGKYIMEPGYYTFNEDLVGYHKAGIVTPIYAVSNFIDYGQISEMLQKAAADVVPVTSGQLTKKGIKESDFPKDGGYVTVSEYDGKFCKIQVKAYFNAWTRQSDGWFSYNFVFNPDSRSGKYIINIEFTGNARSSGSSIFESLTAPITLSEDKNTLKIEDKDFTIENTAYATKFRLSFVETAITE